MDAGELKNIPFNEWCSYNSYTSVYYASKKKLSVNLVTKEIKKIQPDVLFIIGIYSPYFNLVPMLFAKVPRKILSARGMLHPGALSQKKNKKKAYLFLWKLLGLQNKCIFHATDEKEKKYIQHALGNKTNIFIASNFPRYFENALMPKKMPGRLSLVSVALISPVKNFIRILTAMANCNYQIDYNIYGAVNDENYWTLCLEQIKRLPANISVTWHGDVHPANVEAALKGSHVFILPSMSENFGHAIYEALSAGRPAITSNYTPWNNLFENCAGMNVSLDNDIELLKAINFFAEMGNDEIIHWGSCAHDYSEKAIDVEQIKEQYKRMFLGKLNEQL